MIRRLPHLSIGLTDIAAALLTAGGLLWSLAMTGASSPAIGGVICGLHRQAAPGIHCAWCPLAVALVLSGGALLAVEVWRALRAAHQRADSTPN